MNGPIAQIVAIVSYGNEFLLDNVKPKFLMSNSTAKFCNDIKFIDWVKPSLFRRYVKGMKEHYSKSIASNFNLWMDFLAEENVSKLYLHYTGSDNKQTKDRMTAGFIGGGGRWLIEAYKGQTSDFWEAKWEVTDREDELSRIWTVTYSRIARNSEPMIQHHSKIDNVKENLQKSIEDCRDFAKKHSLEGFRMCFENAISCLEEKEISNDTIYHIDIVPNINDINKSKQILFACQPAWVFGGMGSWNDMGFKGEEQKVYDAISENLFSSLCNAIPSATNNL